MYTLTRPSGITGSFLKHTLWFQISTHVGTDPPQPLPVRIPPIFFFFQIPPKGLFLCVASSHLITSVKNNIASSNIALVSSWGPFPVRPVLALLHNFSIDPKQLGDSSFAWICIFTMIPGSVLNVRGTFKISIFCLWVVKNGGSGKFKGVDIQQSRWPLPVSSVRALNLPCRGSGAWSVFTQGVKALQVYSSLDKLYLFLCNEGS